MHGYRSYTKQGLLVARAVAVWAAWGSGIWPGLIQAQNHEGRKALATLSADPLQSLHLSNYVIGIVIVFAALAAVSWVLRRYQPRAGHGLIRIQSCLSLGGRERLLVVEVQGRRLLIGVGNAGISLLRDLEAGVRETPPVVEQDPPAGHRSGNWLQQTLKSVVGS